MVHGVYAQDIPFDLIQPILAQCTDRRDLYAVALVSKTFNQVATPLLYENLTSRLVSSRKVRPIQQWRRGGLTRNCDSFLVLTNSLGRAGHNHTASGENNLLEATTSAVCA